MANEKILTYVKSQLERYSSKEVIYQELLSQGYKVDEIEDVIRLVGKDTNKEDNQKRLIKVLFILGAVLIGAGIFSFIASNWQEIGKITKVAIIIIAMIVSYLSGWHLRENKKLEKTGATLIFLGAVIYGAGIFLVAQIFNIRANWPDGFTIWMLGVILMAFAANIFYLLYLAASLGIVSALGCLFIIFESSIPGNFLQTSFILLIVGAIVAFLVGFFVYKKSLPLIKKDFV